ncbi:unnamed protein product, partial [Cyprideis torosa]
MTTETTLRVACMFGNLQDVLRLLNEGADVNDTNRRRWTPLHVSSYHGHYDVCSLLLERGADLNATTEGGFTPLHLSSQEGHKDVSALLVERGADLNATTQKGSTPLHLSSQNGHEDVSALLLKRGADLNATTKEGANPLHLSSQEGHKDVSALLLERGADLNATTQKGSTPLHLSSKQGHKGVSALLIERGADLNATTKKGATPLHLSSYYGQLDVSALLLERGADICATTCDGRSPLSLCSSNGHKKVVDLLLSRGADIDIPVHEADIDDGRSSLHCACIFGSFDTVEFIHSKGVRWDVMDAYGLNPVHYAVKKRAADFQQKIKKLLGTEVFSRLEQMEVTPRQNLLHSKFEDVAEIGSGSYGKVFKGRLKKNKEWYAIKRLEPKKQFTVENIKQESNWLSSRAFSPFITLCFWRWSEKHGDSNITFLVMELCDSDLYHWMEANPCGKRDRREVLQYVSDIAAGLRFLHSYDGGLIHRDLAARNILLKHNVVIGSDPPRTVAKISDLGLASDKTSAATGEQFPLHSSGWRWGGPFPPDELPSVPTSSPLNYNESID